MAIIKTNENNPAALKLLIASNCAKKTLKTEVINERSISFPVPYLELDSKEFIFISNAAVCYFVPAADLALEVNEWLEWECTLSQTLANLFGGCSKNTKLRQTFSKILEKLNNSLKNRNYLVGSDLTAADISIWSVLYPLIVADNLKQEFLTNHNDILRWSDNLKSISCFKDALKVFNITSSQAAYTALLNGAKYTIIKNQEVEPGRQLESQISTLSQSSPQHQAESITSEEIKAAKEAWTKRSNVRLKKHGKPILPVKGEKNILITSALPYVNNVPHLGNIIGCVLSSDVFARYCRCCNYNTLLIGGTDEYGTATETKALEEGLSCQDICDKYFKIHNEIYKWFSISFDHFGRTTTPQQTQLCQSMFLQLNQNGFIFTESVDQLHCEQCDRYLADRFVEGGCPNIGCDYEDARGDQCDGCGKLVNAVELKNPRCKICKSTPKLKRSSQFFLDLPKLEPLLHHWMKESSPGWSHNAQVIGRTWLKEGLKPRCITRDLKWGVQVPLEGYMDKVFYVWFDAPLGYMSITKNYTEEWEKWWRPVSDVNVILYHFMAKDNVPFHAIMFPATVLGANRGYITVSHIMATEYLNYEDGKFSKSRGVGVFGNDAQETGIPSDVFRFYLLYVRPESQDSSFSWIDFATKNNSELLNNLGNFINRGLMFAKNNFNKIVPDMQLTDEDYTFLALCTREYKSYVSALEKGKLREGIRHILSISRHGNQYMQVNQPWVLLKGSDSDKIRAGTVIGMCCNIACLLATLLHPYMPNTCEELRKQLNSGDFVINSSNPEINCLLPTGHKIGDPAPLFTKIEPSRVEELKKKFAGKQGENGQTDVKSKRKESKKNASNKTPIVNGIQNKSNEVVKIEEEVAQQAAKVRTLKSGGGDKKVWQPEVEILLSLKEKLRISLENSQQNNTNENDAAKSPEVEKIEKQVAAQADKVRSLKSSGVGKTVWQPEVEVLLGLKKKLENTLKGIVNRG